MIELAEGMIRRACMAMLLMPSSVASATAQPDIRLSPTEPMARWLLPDVLMQSAARAGGTTLVAWGTTVNVTDTSIVPVINRAAPPERLPSRGRR
jgi:hypothetical protein